MGQELLHRHPQTRMIQRMVRLDVGIPGVVPSAVKFAGFELQHVLEAPSTCTLLLITKPISRFAVLHRSRSPAANGFPPA